MSSLGTPVRMKYIPCLAFIITSIRSVTDRPRKQPGKDWVKAFERRHAELRASRVKAMDWNRHEKSIYEKVAHWFEVIGAVLDDPAVVAENVYNMDETYVMLSKLGAVKVLVSKHDGRDCRGAHAKRTTVTAIECISADGRCLNPLIIWPTTTHRSNWTTFATPGWHYACSESGYTNSKISFEWLTRVFDPQTKEIAHSRPRVLICDGFGTHETLEILEFCFANNIKLCRLPSHTSHKLQPCNIAVFAPLKSAYRDNAERLERGGVGTIGKQHFTCLYSRAKEISFTRKNILAGWSKGGLFPFNPRKVLQEMESQIDRPEGSLSKQHQIRQAPTMPQAPSSPTTPITPVTPRSLEALISLQNLMVTRDTTSLDAHSRCSIQKCIEKLGRAAQSSFDQNALQQDRINSLLEINSEAKARRATQPVILGRANVMSFEDLKAARAKRMTKILTDGNTTRKARVQKERHLTAKAAKSVRERETGDPLHGQEVPSCEGGRAPVATMY